MSGHDLFVMSFVISAEDVERLGGAAALDKMLADIVERDRKEKAFMKTPEGKQLLAREMAKMWERAPDLMRKMSR
jgi:hypothetical protein